MPGSFSPPQWSITARDARILRRLPLHERTNSQNSQKQRRSSLRQSDGPSTVRLVEPSPSPPQTQAGEVAHGDETSSGDASRIDNNWAQHYGSEFPGLSSSSSSRVEEASVSIPGSSATQRGHDVSDIHFPANESHEALSRDTTPSISLLGDNLEHELPKPSWHRRSTSSGTYSQSSTLLANSEIAFSKKSFKSERYSNFSQVSTLRSTPTPSEQDNRERAALESISKFAPTDSLHTLQETSPERPTRQSTIRAVPPSSDTSSPIRPVPGSSSPSSDTSFLTRPITSSSNFEQPPAISYDTSSVQYSPYPPSTGHISQPLSRHERERPESPAISQGTLPSSPNFIAYTPDSAAPISRDQLRRTTSVESINSRLQFASVARPETGRSYATTASWASHESNDTLFPLQIPKKRLRHKPGFGSLTSQAGSSHDLMMADEDFDPLPYPKRPFSSYLSTIASESETDRQSRIASQHLSHFSLGSGVLTGDEESSLRLSPKDHQRSDSAPADSLRPDSSGTRGTSSSEFQEEAGDMTLGIFREESAIPQPLFRGKAAQIPLNTSRKYEGPMPPLPPIPRGAESDEHVDTLSALQAPPLRQQRSGYSLRGRSNSTPTHSRQQSQISYAESERFSHGSSLFPTWAKHYYTGAAVLSSKVSVGSLSTAGKRPAMHNRNNSSWTERSITSRLGTGYSNSGESNSPSGSHFLPSIFRPRAHRKTGSRASQSTNTRKSTGRSRPSQERPSGDSMAINPAPLPQEGEGPASEVLPSGQPKWGTLKDPESPPEKQHRSLPRKYNRQRQWDQMEFPRPMTKDRLSDFGVHHEPYLAPSKRSSQNRLSAWRAPSFVSSLDTLITSRCNRQILLFALGFICPLTWMLGAVLPVPKKPTSAVHLEKGKSVIEGSEEDVQIAMMKHEAGDAERRWREERQFLKGTWWRMLNRIMSVIGLLVIAAVIALVVVATR